MHSISHGTVGAAEADADATEILTVFNRINFGSKYAFEDFDPVLRSLKASHPRCSELSYAQIVACKSRLKPKKVRVTDLDKAFGFKMNFKGKAKVEAERNREGKRKFFVIPDRLDWAFVYVYEITGGTDPTRGWYSLDPKNRGPKSYFDCKTAESKATYLTNFHDARFTEATGDNGVKELIDLAHFDTDPTDGFNWTDNNNQVVSWDKPTDGTVPALFISRERTLRMKNSNGNGGLEQILSTLTNQSKNQDQMIDRLATQSNNQDQMIGSLAARSNNHDQMIGNITDILRELQSGQLETRSTVRQQGIQIEQNAENIAQVDNRVNGVVDDVAEIRGQLESILNANATEQQPSNANRLNGAGAEVGIGLPDANAVEVDGNPPAQEQELMPDLNQAEEAFLVGLPSPGDDGIETGTDNILYGKGVVLKGTFVNVRGGEGAMREMVEIFGGRPLSQLRREYRSRSTIICVYDDADACAAALDRARKLDILRYTVDELLRKMTIEPRPNPNDNDGQRNQQHQVEEGNDDIEPRPNDDDDESQQDNSLGDDGQRNQQHQVEEENDDYQGYCQECRDLHAQVIGYAQPNWSHPNCPGCRM